MRSGGAWLLAASVLIAGCSTYFTELRVREAPEGTPTWRIGYGDGCQSGRQEARGQRPENKVVEKDRYRADDDYRTGWKQGFDDCFARTKKEESETPLPTPEPTPMPVAVAPPPAVVEPAPAPAPVVVAPVPPPSSAKRRAEIESRIRELRGEIQGLERELEALPAE